jgi:hypothetical protein
LAGTSASHPIDSGSFVGRTIATKALNAGAQAMASAKRW